MYGFVGLFLLIRAAGDCMVRVHCSKDTLDAGVATRSRKVVKSITAARSPRSIRVLIKRLRLRLARRSASAVSRASKPDMDGLKSASSLTAGVWRRNEEKWRLLWAAFVVVCDSDCD